jgi:hypothetical protein
MASRSSANTRMIHGARSNATMPTPTLPAISAMDRPGPRAHSQVVSPVPFMAIGPQTANVMLPNAVH